MLNSLLTDLKTQFQLSPVWGIELEFYVRDALPEAEILSKLNQLPFALQPAEKERGKTQYEVALHPIANTDEFIEQSIRLRNAIKKTLTADFSAKPFDDYGSALHFHLHLQNSSLKNMYRRNEEGYYSDELLHSLGGLLAQLPQSLSIFSPHDRTRFQTTGLNSPTHICWGTNNRTVALRLPTAPAHHKRIEHRVASADANIKDCVEAILEGVIYGLQNHCEAPDPIYGNAWDAQYKLTPLIGEHQIKA